MIIYITCYHNMSFFINAYYIILSVISSKNSLI